MKTFLASIRQLPRALAIALAALLACILFIYYPIGMILVHEVDDDREFSVSKPEAENGSHAVAIAVALLDREINRHHWTPNDPFFLPGSALTRMPAFQRGIVSSIARFSIEMADQIGRTRGSSQSDPDLQKAVGLLNYSPYVWLFDFSTSWLPTTSSEKQYRSGMEALERYNQRLVNNEAVFDRRADNLMETLSRIANDLGSSSAALSEHIDHHSSMSFGEAAELYYFTKGRLYGNYMLLRELEKDFADVIKEKQLQTIWAQMLVSLQEGMELRNFIVFNADPDNQLLPNHLAAQGFFLMRARTQIYEITNILLK